MEYDLDLSDAYVDRLEELEIKCLDDEQMKTFLSDCFIDDDTISEVWESIKNNYFNSSPYNICKIIDFNSRWLDASCLGGVYPKIKVYISDDIKLEVNVDIRFIFNWNANKGDYDAYCEHDYTASAIHIENITIV